MNKSKPQINVVHLIVGLAGVLAGAFGGPRVAHKFSPAPAPTCEVCPVCPVVDAAPAVDVAVPVPVLAPVEG